MRKKLFGLIAASLVASGLIVAPAKAAPVIPAVVQIEDATGDANGYSAFGAPNTVSFGAADIQKVWFDTTAETLSVSFATATNPQPESLYFEVYVAPSGAAEPCLALLGVTKGNASSTYVAVDDRDCSDEGAFTRIEGGEFVIENTEDGANAVKTLRFPRAASDYFKEGAVLAQPSALVRLAVETPQGSSFPGLIDTTAVGTDYTVSGGGSEEPPVVGEPGDEEPKKNCKKIKNKKKRKKCKKQQAGNPQPGPGGEEPEAPGETCAAYAPGEQGAEAESFVVKDEHTAEAPLEITINHPEPLTTAFANVQVDSAAEQAGLYVSYQFPVYEDHDLYLNYADGTEAAHAGGFNQAPFVPTTTVPGVLTFGTDGTGNGGHSAMGSENLDGVLTADCGGYTAEFSNFLGEGGDYTVKLWLGEPTWDPAAQAPLG